MAERRAARLLLRFVSDEHAGLNMLCAPLTRYS